MEIFGGADTSNNQKKPKIKKKVVSEKISKETSKDQKFDQLDLLSGNNSQTQNKNPHKNAPTLTADVDFLNQDDPSQFIVSTEATQEPSIQAFNIDMETYQTEWDAMENDQQEFSVNWVAGINKLQKKIKAIGFAIIDIEDDEIICAASFKKETILLYVSYSDEGESEAIVACRNSDLQNKVVLEFGF